jgi:hypothetical protein
VKQLIRNPKYEPETFRDLTKGDVRNCQGASVARRLVKIKVQMNMGSTNEHFIQDVSDDSSSDTD